MQKCVDLKSLGTELQIISAFALEHRRGFIFIEAYKQCHINEVNYILLVIETYKQGHVNEVNYILFVGMQGAL